MYCSKCGAEIGDNSQFCSKCGNPTGNVQPTPPATGPGTTPLMPPPPARGGMTTGRVVALILAAVIGVLLVVCLFMLIVKEGNDTGTDTPTTETVTHKDTVVIREEVSVPASTAASVRPAPGPPVAPRSSAAPSKRTMRSIGFTGDFSDIACYTWLTDADLYGLSKSELRILRNTIYARHGRRFKSADLRNYFNGFSWYYPTKNEVSPSELSSTERHNIQLIQQYE